MILDFRLKWTKTNYLEESDESNFWLTFIIDIDLIKPNPELDFLIKESDELVTIFTSALKTLNKSKI